MNVPMINDVALEKHIYVCRRQYRARDVARHVVETIIFPIVLLYMCESHDMKAEDRNVVKMDDHELTWMAVEDVNVV
jgi:hypothetical protein